MARYWVGGTGNWDNTATGKWADESGGDGDQAEPTSTDDVYFDAASGAVTVTISATSACRNLDFTGFTGTLAGTSTLVISGGLVLGSGMTNSWTGTLQFNATSGTHDIACNGIYLRNTLSVSGVGGSWRWTSKFLLTSNKTITLTNGSIDTNGFDTEVGFFNSNNNNVRTLVNSGNLFTLTGTGSVWQLNDTTNMTWDGSTTDIRIINDGITGSTFRGGSGKTYRNLYIAQTGSVQTNFHASSTGGAINTITFNRIVLETQDRWLRFDNDVVVSAASWEISGEEGHIVEVDPVNNGGLYTLIDTSGGLVSLDFMSFENASVSPTWYAGDNSTDLGGNSGIIFTSPPAIDPQVSTPSAVRSSPLAGRATRLQVTTQEGDAIRTQWRITSGGQEFDVITGNPPANAANVVDSGVDFIDLWLPPFQSITFRVRQYIHGKWGPWSEIGSGESRGLVNSYEQYAILNAGTTTIVG